MFIPTGVELIDSYAFNGCTSLNYVYYCGTERQWSDILIRSNNNLRNKKDLEPKFKGVCKKSVLIEI